MAPGDQAAIDARILTYYSELFDESARLTTRSSQGALELIRTLQTIEAHSAGGRIVDIGGGPGVLARALADAGNSVELIDPVPRHVDRATRAGISARVGDARRLPFADAEFDAALVLGPLYHLADPDARVRALKEAARVTRPGGVVFAGAISRFSRFSSLHLGSAAPHEVTPDLVAVLTQGTSPPHLRFPAGHFHTADELQTELEDAGLDVLEVIGVEGPAGFLLESITDASDELTRAAVLVAQEASTIPAVRELSAHLLAVGVVPAAG